MPIVQRHLCMMCYLGWTNVDCGGFKVIDWLPTLLHAAGYDMRTLPRNLDGIDQWDVLSNNLQSVCTCMLYNCYQHIVCAYLVYKMVAAQSET